MTFSTNLPAKLLSDKPVSLHLGHLSSALALHSSHTGQQPFVHMYTGRLIGGAPHIGHSIKSPKRPELDMFGTLTCNGWANYGQFPAPMFASTLTEYRDLCGVLGEFTSENLPHEWWWIEESILLFLNLPVTICNHFLGQFRC